jgi:hypothetical protein
MVTKPPAPVLGFTGAGYVQGGGPMESSKTKVVLIDEMIATLQKIRATYGADTRCAFSGDGAPATAMGIRIGGVPYAVIFEPYSDGDNGD